jgi:chitodextrinase
VQFAACPGGKLVYVVPANGLYVESSTVAITTLPAVSAATHVFQPYQNAVSVVICTIPEVPGLTVTYSTDPCLQSHAVVEGPVAAASPSPNTPAALVATAASSSQINLTWTASGGSDPATSYLIQRCSGTNCTNFVLIGSSTSAAYSDSGLTPGTSYSYQVEANDNNGDLSAFSNTATATTNSGADTTPPTAPAALAATAASSAQINLGWTASSDNVGVTGYLIERCQGVGCASFVQIGTTTSTTYNDSGLAAATTYDYRVRAADAAGNLSTYSNVASARTTTGSVSPITVTPRIAALTLLQTQQFTTNTPNGTLLIWSVDGVAGGNTTVGTVSNTGLYTPPASPGSHSVSAANASYTGSATVAVTDLTGVTTYHNDNARTGQNLQEYALTPTSVSGGTFGKRWSCPVDGAVYAQPLYVANLSIGGGTHNVLFVATMNDSLYAFDADNPSCVTYWQVSFINAAAGITTTSSATAGCPDFLGNYGILGTPVIDPVALTIYFVTNTTESGNVVQRLHALNLATGADINHSPVVIQATAPGTGDGSATVTFNPLYENQRLGLTLAAGGVVIGWSSHCDGGPWYGWLMRYDASTLTQTGVFNATPNNSGGGGIWMGAGAPALDSSDDMFFSTGNGLFDDTSSAVPSLSPNNDFGESFLNLNPTTLALQDFYTPSQNAAWTENDSDISSAGITVLPDGAGPTTHPNVLVGFDKQGHVWMIDRNNMSGFQPNADNTVQYLYLSGTCAGWCIFSSPAYWNGTVYGATNYGHVMAFQLSNGLLPTIGQSANPSSESAEIYLPYSPTPVISASPTGGAIVWALDNNANGTDNDNAPLGPAILRGYDATNLATTLYSSAVLSADAGGNAVKFTLPVIANGHVYIGGAGVVTVYGLAPD